jgi:hypothetical protein
MQFRNSALFTAIVGLAMFTSIAAARPALADQDDHTTYQQNCGNGTWSNGHWYPSANGYGANQPPNRGNDRDDRARNGRNQTCNGQYYGSSPYYNGAPNNGQPRYAGTPYYGGTPYSGPAPYYNGVPYNNGGTYTYNGGYARGNAMLQGVIVGVNGDQLIVKDDSGRGVQVNDQPALDAQSSGRVYVGRSIHAVGYWQNGVFYATQMN